MSERRQHFRRRTLLGGRLEIAKLNGWALDCSVRNLSDGGAKVDLPRDVVVPQDVGLAVSGKLQRPARLVWHRDGQAGFALVDPRREDANVTDAFQFAPQVRLAARRVAAIV